MKKINSPMLVGKFVDALRCPLCESDLRVVDMNSLVCRKKHTFDFSKQGYLNLLTRPSSTTQYNKELFEARHNIITESNLYSPLHEAIARVIKKHFVVFRHPFLIGDLGCGEGSHLQKIIDECHHSTLNGVGLDLAKDGIRMAAKRYEQGIWLVSDLAKSPFRDQSLHVILNILSPSNYKEFTRMSAQDGLVVKVVPGSNYLKELREVLFHHPEKKTYQNDKTVSLFNQHFVLLDEIHLTYTKKLQQEELGQLVKMTPLAWSGDQRTIDRYIHQDSAVITVDLELLVGRNPREVEADNHGKGMH